MNRARSSGDSLLAAGAGSGGGGRVGLNMDRPPGPL